MELRYTAGWNPVQLFRTTRNLYVEDIDVSGDKPVVYITGKPNPYEVTRLDDGTKAVVEISNTSGGRAYSLSAIVHSTETALGEHITSIDNLDDIKNYFLNENEGKF